MNVFATDSQTVGETSSTLLSIFPVSGKAVSFTLQNVGVNILSFTLQGSNDGGQTWTNIDQPGGPTNTTLLSTISTSFVTLSSYQQLQVIGFASGGTILNFSVALLYNRASGGGLSVFPI